MPGNAPLLGLFYTRAKKCWQCLLFAMLKIEVATQELKAKLQQNLFTRKLFRSLGDQHPDPPTKELQLQEIKTSYVYD